MADNLQEVDQSLAEREGELKRKKEAVLRREQELEMRRSRAVILLNGCKERRQLFASK